MKTYDPNLREAVKEIQAVLKKYDCMALVNMGSKTHGEFILHLNTTWSKANTEETKDGKAAIRVRAKAVKVGTPDHENLEGTAGFICNTADFCNRFGQIMYGLKAELGKVSELTYDPMTDDRVTNDDRE